MTAMGHSRRGGQGRHVHLLRTPPEPDIKSSCPFQREVPQPDSCTATNDRGLHGYSITSSARSKIDAGTVKPSVLAVLRLTKSSNLAGCMTGRSAGFVPWRILPV